MYLLMYNHNLNPYPQVAVRLITDFSEYPRDHVPMAIQKHVQAAKINRENQGGGLPYTLMHTHTDIINIYIYIYIYYSYK